MIGHYLLTLTPEQEDRVLTSRLARAPTFLREDGCRCLMGTADNLTPETARRRCNQSIVAMFSGSHENRRLLRQLYSPGRRFDDLCVRFGEERINRAIRNRILANQARRTLAPTTVTAEV